MLSGALASLASLAASELPPAPSTGDPGGYLPPFAWMSVMHSASN